MADTGIGYWKNDVRGAVVYATWKLMQRPGVKLTHMMWNFMDLVAGQQLQLTNPDGSRTFVSVYMHENKLLTMEGTVPAGVPGAGTLPTIAGMARRERTERSVPVCLLQRPGSHETGPPPADSAAAG